MRKKVFVAMLVLAVSLVGAGQMMAQNRRCMSQEECLKLHAECMTERMAYAYGLNEAQKEALQEANEAWLQKIGDVPCQYVGRRGWGRRAGRRNCCGGYAHDGYYMDSCPYYKDCPRISEAGTKEWKAARREYINQLKQIMTEEQYEDYMLR